MKFILIREGTKDEVLTTVKYKIVPPAGTDFQHEFCEVQPSIREYALENAEQMATILIFVLASIKSSWGNMVANFPDLMFKLYQDNVVRKDKEKDLPFSNIVFGKEDSIQSMWNNRSLIYGTLAPIIEEHKTTKNEALVLELYRTLVQLRGYGLPKAAFVVQLLIGRLGCIDSINSNIYKAQFPESMISGRDPLQFKTVMTSKSGGLTAGAEKLIQDYQKFVNAIFKADTMQTSRLLWNNWTAIVAEKIRFRNQEGKIAIEINKEDGNTETFKIDPYMRVGGKAEKIYQARKELETASGVSQTHHPLAMHPHLKLEEILFSNK